MIPVGSEYKPQRKNTEKNNNINIEREQASADCTQDTRNYQRKDHCESHTPPKKRTILFILLNYDLVKLQPARECRLVVV